MNELILICPHNTPGRNPATGRLWRDGDEFMSESMAYKELHGGKARISAINNQNPPEERFARVLRVLAPNDKIENRLDALTVFCHGYKTGLQIGVDLTNLQEFCEALAVVSRPELTVTLYACSAAADTDRDLEDERAPGPGGDGGFADQLRDVLDNAGVKARVLAHSTRGHCTRNPFVREFARDQRLGGDWIVEPDSELWPRWRRELAGSLRFRFPRLSKDEVHAALRG